MSDNSSRTIRKADHGVTVELIEDLDPYDDPKLIRMEFSEVELLPNGWVECRGPDDEEDRVNFFPPNRVVNIIVYDEDGGSAASSTGTWG